MFDISISIEDQPITLHSLFIIFIFLAATTTAKNISAKLNGWQCTMGNEWKTERERKSSSVNGLIQICQNQLIPLEHCHKMDYRNKTTIFLLHFAVGSLLPRTVRLFLFNFHFAGDCVNIVHFRLCGKANE